MASTSWVLSYAPPYYWVVGFGQRLAATLAGVQYASAGGRIASFVLNLAALLLQTYDLELLPVTLETRIDNRADTVNGPRSAE